MESSTTFCSHCGQPRQNNENFCPKCGQPFIPNSAQAYPEPLPRPDSYDTNSFAASRVNPQDAPSVGMWILGFFIPLAGLLIWVLQQSTYPQRSRSALTGAIVAFVAGIVIRTLLSLG